MKERNYNLGPRAEREFTISGADLDQSMYIYTNMDTMITKLDKLVDVGAA